MGGDVKIPNSICVQWRWREGDAMLFHSWRSYTVLYSVLLCTREYHFLYCINTVIEECT